eukprot:TRINITY_DN3504_c0_g1_i1.p1 TRINITY_DN3504_c0_g1~~TRINITY_DN3504_c0_g1_i1.p1  ORF type:complete len:339 (+),score=120.29 TRINITY_DN3504_c0_g1_i1:66-1082(+)
MSKTRAIHLVNRPIGLPDSKKDFALVEEDIPQLEQGGVLLKTLYVSVDPYMRGRMKDIKSYFPCFSLNKALDGGVVAEVEESKNEKFQKGDLVQGLLSWRDRNVVNDVSGLHKLPKDSGVPPSYFLGILGMPGMTALLALEIIGQPKQGETLVVSGAAGAVGSLVGQIGKILGLKVVGIAGGPEKISFLKNKLGFDEVIDYKATDDMKAAISKACPNGVDVYYDNVGGKISDGVSANFNRFGRWVLCGAISQYNNETVETGPRDEFLLISRSITKQGFIVTQWMGPKWEAGVAKMAGYLKAGKIVAEETLREGLENIPNAFVEMLTGANTGKMIVKIN